MKWISLATLFLSTLFLNSCEAPPEERKKDKAEKVESKDEKHKHGDHSHSSEAADPADKANAHMHKSSVEDLIERFESEERDAYQQPEKVLDYLGDVAGKSIIDIGAGSGYFSIKLARRGAQVIAADVNEEFQAYVSLRRAEENLEEQIETRLIPYDSPGLDSQEVDMALIVNTYHHIKNRVDYFSKVKTGLKKGGELVVVDELKKAGYKDIQAEVDLLPHQYIIRAQ